MLQRMRTLAVQSASDTNTTADRTALNTEFELLRTEIDRIGTTPNGTARMCLIKASTGHTVSGGRQRSDIDLTIAITVLRRGTALPSHGGRPTRLAS